MSQSTEGRLGAYRALDTADERDATLQVNAGSSLRGPGRPSLLSQSSAPVRGGARRELNPAEHGPGRPSLLSQSSAPVKGEAGRELDPAEEKEAVTLEIAGAYLPRGPRRLTRSSESIGDRVGADRDVVVGEEAKSRKPVSTPSQIKVLHIQNFIIK